jgi:hypothetical protein
MRAFKNTWFTRYADKNEISDEDLKDVVNILEAGLADAGGGVYKVRFARKGEGKRGGYRVVLFFKETDKIFFEYCFAKSERENIKKEELKFFRKSARIKLSMTTEQIESAINAKELIEIEGV